MDLLNLRGRTSGQKGTRLTTKEVDPKGLAVWTFREFDPKLRKYFYEIYDKAIHSTLSMSPRDKFASGLNLTGERTHEIIGFTDDFRILTCPTTRKGTAKVQNNRGVKILHVYYWCDAFRHPDVERTNVPVRYDPDNRGIAYAFVKGVWRTLYSSYYDIF